MSAPYNFEIVPADRLAEIDTKSWSSLCDCSANPFMDLRFLAALHNSMGDQARFWAVLFRDDQRRPIAATYLSTYRIDAIPNLPQFLRPPSRWIRYCFRNYLNIPLLIVGQPIGTGQGNLVFRSDVDLKTLCAALDRVARQIAREMRTQLILFKEFDTSLADQLKPLQQRGYARIPSVITYTLPSEYRNFEHYYETRSKRTRANMRKVMAKADEAGLICRQLAGGETAAVILSDEIHKLYENVRRRGERQFEVVPLEFFRELARQFPDQARFTLLQAGDRVVGFCCGLTAERRHTMLYCGVDYDLNDQAAVYFNTVYRGLEAALETDAVEVNIGQSADEFKRRLGCQATPLFMFIRPTGFMLTILWNLFRPILFRRETVGIPCNSATQTSQRPGAE